jgi:hypothetical protein
MQKYYLRILFGSSFSETTIVAYDVDFDADYIFFNDEDGNVIATYPPNCTIITKIEDIEYDEETE